MSILSELECHCSLQESIEPGERSLQSIYAMARLAQAVTFARVTHEHSFHAAPTERHVHFFGLRDVHVVVLFSVDE